MTVDAGKAVHRLGGEDELLSLMLKARGSHRRDSKRRVMRELGWGRKLQ